MKLSNDLLAAIYLSVGQGIITIDEDSQILMANPRVVEVWGYSPAELIGQSITMLMPERYRERHKAGLKRYARTRRGEAIGQWLEVEGVKRDGAIFPLEIRIEETPLVDRLVFTAAVRDHSQAAQALRAAKQNQKKLRQQARDLKSQRDALTQALDRAAAALREGDPSAVLAILESASQSP